MAQEPSTNDRRTEYPEWDQYDPCPECGQHERFVQTIVETENVHIGPDGIPDYFEPLSDALGISSIACPECDTVLFVDPEVTLDE